MATEIDPKERAALEARQLELELFWKRSLFFWGFIASAFVGLAWTYDKHSALAIVLSCFGLVCSFCWTLVNRGSKFWYEAWEQVIETMTIGDIFSAAAKKQPKSRWWSPRFSVSRIAIILSDYVTLLWLALIIYQLWPTYFDQPLSSRWIVVIASIAWMVYGFFAAKRS